VTVIGVPYHLDEPRPGLDYPLEPGVTVTAGAPAGDIWSRLGALYSDVAARVAADAGAGGAPVVMSGVDLDVIDSAALPGLLFPAPGGPAPAAVTAALRTVLATGRVAALGVACTWRAGHGAGRIAAAMLDAALAGWPPGRLPPAQPGGGPGAPRAG
jgi:hypothetical protein